METAILNSPVLARNNVQVMGSGQQPLMMAHGFGCDQNMWRLVAPAFENDAVLTNAVRHERGGSWVIDCVFLPMRQSSLL